MIETAVLFAAFFLLSFFWYRKRKKDMSFFEILNIPGPKPHLITGNLTEYCQKGAAKCQLEWTKKYGSMVGYYLGAKPILLVSDSEFWKWVQIKDFENFTDRDLFISDGGVPHEYAHETLSLKKGTQWRNNRSLLSPSFSTNKLKQTIPLIEDAIETFLDIIRKKAVENEEFNILPMYHVLTMDIIGRTAFGIRTNIQKNPQDIFVKNIKYASVDSVSSQTVWLILCFQELEAFLCVFRLIFDKIRGIFGLPSMTLLFQNLNEVIQSRRSNKSFRQDLLQIMLDANISSEELKNITGDKLTTNLESDLAPKSSTIKDPTRKSTSTLHYLTNPEVMGNSLLFIIGGYETTGTTLSFVTHFLVNYPEIQEKVREEVNSVLQNEELGYLSVSKMHYLHRVISETLRLYPVVLTFTTRKVGKTFSYKNLTLPKGLALQHATWQTQRDPKIWQDPGDFDPDRFIPERKDSIDPFAYQPFGNGPRNCIGMRFAYLVMKLILASLLRSYRFVPGKNTEQEPLPLEVRLFQINPLNGINLRAVPL